MRSDGSHRPLRDHPLLAALGSVRVSLVLGFTTAGMLILSSFFVPSPRGPGALPFDESIVRFFTPVADKYAWFYALLAVTSAYGVNGLFGTWRNFSQRVASRTFDRRFAGIFLMHLGFVVGVVAHLVAGLTTAVEGRAVLSSAPVELAGRSLRLLDATEIPNADGSLRTFTSHLDLGDGDVRTLGYNDPVFFDGFRRWILVEGPQEVPGDPVFSVAGAPAPVDEAGAFVVGEAGSAARYVVQRVSRHPSLPVPMVQVRRVDGGPAQWLRPGSATADGLRLDGFARGLGVAVVVRRNDGLPLVVLASALFLVGLVLYTWDAVRRPR